MKKFVSFFLIFIFLISVLTSCREKDFVKATDDDFSVILPDEVANRKEHAKRPVILNDEAKAFIGKWKLISIADDSEERTYTDSFYVFGEDGSYFLTVGKETANGRFSVSKGVLYLGRTPLEYKIEADKLTLLTTNKKTHTLYKAN